jgi:hypothetical protein
MKRLLIWATGYDQPLLERYHASAGDRRMLGMIGASMLFACLWFGSMATLAAWTMAFQFSGLPRLAISAFAGALAISFVLVFDRAFIFGADTSAAKLGKTILFGIVRILIVVSVGSLVDVSIMPMVMGPELEQHAAQMRNDADEGRLEKLNKRFDISSRRTERDAAQGDFDAAERAAATLPPAILSALAQAARCFATLPGPGTEREAQRRQCMNQRRNAQAQRAEYLRTANAKLTRTRIALDDAQSGFKKARDTVQSQLDASTYENAKIYVASNFQVFVSLVTTHPGAAIKAAVLAIIHLVFDLLPFLVKAYYGRTGVGARIRASKEAERLDAEAEMQGAHDDYQVRIASSRAAAAAAKTALSLPSMIQFMEEMAETEMRTVEPAAQALAIMQRITSAEVDMVNIPTRTPAMWRLKAELWSNAVANSLNAAMSRA